MEQHKVALGDEVVDKVTGFTGIAMSKTVWLNGCVRIGVQPQALGEKGKCAESEVFDESQLEIKRRATVAAMPEWGTEHRPPLHVEVPRQHAGAGGGDQSVISRGNDTPSR